MDAHAGQRADMLELLAVLGLHHLIDPGDKLEQRRIGHCHVVDHVVHADFNVAEVAQHMGIMPGLIGFLELGGQCLDRVSVYSLRAVYPANR